MGLPGAVVPAHHKRAATRRAVKGTQPAVGRNGLLGAQWDSGRYLPDAQGIALHTAPTQETISSHQMSQYQRPLVLARHTRRIVIEQGRIAFREAPAGHNLSIVLSFFLAAGAIPDNWFQFIE